MDAMNSHCMHVSKYHSYQVNTSQIKFLKSKPSVVAHTSNPSNEEVAASLDYIVRCCLKIQRIVQMQLRDLRLKPQPKVSTENFSRCVKTTTINTARTQTPGFRQSIQFRRARGPRTGREVQGERPLRSR